MLNVAAFAAAKALQENYDRISSPGAAVGRKARDATRDLEERLDKLTLISMALWSLLKERTELSEEDLVQRVKEIDLADGVQDGKFKNKINRCPKCNRVMSPRHRKCLYCGSENLTLTAFDTVL